MCIMCDTIRSDREFADRRIAELERQLAGVDKLVSNMRALADATHKAKSDHSREGLFEACVRPVRQSFAKLLSPWPRPDAAESTTLPLAGEDGC